MKKNILLLSYSGLLLLSSSTLSQATESNGTTITHDQLATQSLPHRFDQYADEVNSQNGLLLATADTYTDNKNDARLENIIAEHNSNQAEAGTEATQAKYFSDEELINLRLVFLQAERSVKKNRKAEYIRLTDQLKGYPLQPYIQYQWLKKHLNDEQQVKTFLQQHESSRYARKLKYKWLHHLAKRKQWKLFLQYNRITSNSRLSCYHHLAQFNTGSKQVALIGAAKLWAVGHSQPRQCDPLFSLLKKSSQFTQDLIWQRFDATLQNNKLSLAVYVKNLLPKTEQSTAQLWINLHRNPSRYMPQLLNQKRTAQSALMFRHAIDRLARNDVTTAIKIWDANKQAFNVETKYADRLATNKLEKRLAFKLAFKGESGAYERLSQLDSPDESSQAWRVRVALTEQNWPNVQSAIDAMDETEKKMEKWQYWSARAYLEAGDIEQAEKIFSDLSKKRDFYGYLSADKINSMYQLSDNPVHVPAKEIDRLENSKEYRVAYELMKLERTTEAKLQWWHALRQLDKDEIMTAAKLAKRWQWDEIAIFTIAKIKHWDDIDLRFPLSYSDKIHENSEQQKLNPAIVFGLVRRESAFNEKARSPTGARGLMQIMPNTGKQIARDFNERWSGSNSLYNPEKNLKYGSYYYQKLLNKFDGNYALALAAYNAGPHRVKKWLPKDETMPADIWIETIPFHETRDYVTAVLTYTLIYQQRTQPDEQLSINTLTMNTLTRDIQPLGSF